MRTATTVEGMGGGSWQDTLAFVREAEAAGLDVCWVAEAWGSDAPSVLGALAMATSRLVLGSGVMQLGTRTPAAVALTAATLAEVTGGRFLLGLGTSGPQVIEGLHGVAFAHPLGRMRETIDVIRSVWSGEKVDYAGRHITVPLPGGEGRPMRAAFRPSHPIPLYLAALSPKMLELTGEMADGWLGTSFVPEGATAYLDPLRAGASRAGRTLADIDICQGAEVNIVNGSQLEGILASRKGELAFSLGGMGTASTNFYNDAYSRQGWADVAAAVRDAWQAGDRARAADLVTDDMVLATTLIGTADRVRDRLRTWRDVGVDQVRLYPAGDTIDAKLANLAEAVDMVRDINREAPGG
jgi:F420-dependent oxidoreductase-like protein